MTNGRSYAIPITDVAPRSAAIGIKSMGTTWIELASDYPGEPDALQSITDLGAFAVPDLYRAQLRPRA